MPDNKPTTLELVRHSAQQTHNAVFSGKGDSPSPDSADAGSQSTARAVQSIGQTTAIVIQDAGDMLRNVSTVEVTSIGAATAAWIATKDPIYKEIINTSMDVMNQAAALYVTIGTDAFKVLAQFSTKNG
jgi:hypothetical protein